MTFEDRLRHCARPVEARLAEILGGRHAEGVPPRLKAAMEHAVFAGGKRFRPLLVIDSARLFGVSDEAALDAAAALECVHCYSLVHDDLPAMDDDDLRRGQPTVHKRFGEATAILAGDALLTLAFEIAAGPSTHPDPLVRARLVSRLAAASGASGMVGGQLLDLAAEGRFGEPDGERPAGSREPLHLGRPAIELLQEMKTGALIRFAVEAGGILGSADSEAMTALSHYGQALGLAFQLSDDLLDAEGEAATLGKATAKDAAQGKATLVSFLGVEAARVELARIEATALDALERFGPSAEGLRDAARFMVRRRR